MGIYLCKLFITNNKKEKDKEIELKKQKNKDNIKTNINKSTIKLNLKETYEINSQIYNLAQFPSGNILITTDESIQIFNKNFTLLKTIKKKVKDIYIKDDKIFLTCDKKIINIWLIEYENNNIIQIKLLSEISHDGDHIYKVVILDNFDIIGTDYRTIFTYIKINNVIPYIYSLLNKLKKSVFTFLITKDNKNMIIYKYPDIEIYQINKMKLISIYKNAYSCLYSSSKELFLIDDFTLVIQYGHDPMTIMEPPDILIFYDIKDINNIKIIGKVPLETYYIGSFTKDKMYISTYIDDRKCVIYTFQNLLNIIKNNLYDNYSRKKITENEAHIIEFEKRYYLNRFSSHLYILNGNKIIISERKKLDAYSINLK